MLKIAEPNRPNFDKTGLNDVWTNHTIHLSPTHLTQTTIAMLRDAIDYHSDNHTRINDIFTNAEICIYTIFGIIRNQKIQINRVNTFMIRFNEYTDLTIPGLPQDIIDCINFAAQHGFDTIEFNNAGRDVNHDINLPTYKN